MNRLGEIGLYPIMTRPALPYRDFAEVCVDCGVRMLQLREKSLSDRELLTLAREIVAVTRGTNTRFIIDDRIDIAILSGADGVHLGQDDLPPDEARYLLPPDMLLGLSTHSPAQARIALTCSPDYIGYGPLYPTPTKLKPDPVIGLADLRVVVESSYIPVTAIGGIFPENLPKVIQAGARTIAMVRWLMEAGTCSELRQRIVFVQDSLNNLTRFMRY